MRSIPLLIIPIVLYNFLALLGGNTHSSILISLSFGGQGLSADSLLVLLGIAMLCLEVIKSAYSGRGSVLDQILSIILLIICIVQLFLFGYIRTEHYIFLVSMQAVDVISSLVVVLQANGKDIYYSKD